ncbi:MAG: disulfide oxidoreductase [bacterium]|jgi:hypothetical protein
MEAVAFHENMTVGEILTADPRAKHVLAYFHIGGCHHCSVDDSATLKQVSEDFGVPLEMLLKALNKLSEM